MSRQVVQVQPESRVQGPGQWSTGLCECYKDMGDCKCLNMIKYTVWYTIWWNLQCMWPSAFPEMMNHFHKMSRFCGLWVDLQYSVCVAGCFALCCLPVFTCKVTNAVGACPCLPLLDCIGCVPPASLAMRASVRERYGIQVVRHRIHFFKEKKIIKSYIIFYMLWENVVMIKTMLLYR